MAIVLAVSPSTLTPGLYLTVDLLAGASSPGTGVLRTALVAPKSSAGDLTVDTEVRALGGEATATTAFGQGTPGHLAAKLIYQEFPTAQIDAIAPTAGLGTATLQLTFAGAPTSNNVIDCDIMGRQFEVAWLVGDAVNDVRDRFNDAVNQRTDSLSCTAAAGAAGISDVNGKVLGNISNDIIVDLKLRNGTTGTETINTGTSVTANLAGGTSDPDITTALSNLAGREYHFIVPCLSNTDAANIATANNISKVYTHINNLNTGLESKLQQFVVGYSGTLSNALATTPSSNSCNNATFGQLPFCISGRGLPAELAGREAGGRLAAVTLDPAANRIGELLDGYIGAKDKIADKPTAAEAESAVGGGVSIVSYTAQDSEYALRPVTTHSQDSVGAPDRRLLDTQNVDATYIVARDVRDNLPAAFPNAKIQEDADPGDDPPPAGVIEERDIKGWLIARLRFWQTKGVINKAALDAAIAGGTLIVQVNSSDPTQVDIVIPIEIIQPLAKFGVVVQRIPS